MAESWRNQKGVTAALALAVVVVWGAVGWTALSAVRDDGLDESALEPIAVRPEDASLEGPARPYDASFRDPFAPYVVRVDPVARRAVPQPPSGFDEGVFTGDAMTFEEALEFEDAGVPERPPWTLRGIVGQTAILEMGGRSVVARAGDTVGETDVVRVDDVGVVLRYRGYDFTLMP